MDIVNADGWSLTGLANVNVIAGKNGCGKSTLLRAIERQRDALPNVGHVAYITPERSGTLEYQAHIEQDLIINYDNVRSNRRSNQIGNFKQQSVAQYRKLENMVLREIETHVDNGTANKASTFQVYLTRLNSLLDEIQLIRKRNGFDLATRKGQILSPSAISSGEAELIALGIETLVFEKEATAGKENLLLLDEPDVHLHPDLQVRLVEFIHSQLTTKGLRVVIATHSTAILGALQGKSEITVAFMRSGERSLAFRPVNQRLERILPVFGAHPLSNVFNAAPILLVEGEDDERVWQQAIRTSRGRIRAHPCHVDTVMELNDHEREIREVMDAVYDRAQAYSIRDGDGKHEELVDEAPVCRFRLQCYAIENLLLTNEVLEHLGTTWEKLKLGIDDWINANGNHPHFDEMKKFKESGPDRRDFRIKLIRNDLMGIVGSDKPWEVAVGQVIGQTCIDADSRFDADGSLLTFIGRKAAVAMLC